MRRVVMMLRRAAICALTSGALPVLLSLAVAVAAELPRGNIVLESAISVDPDANTVVLPLHRGEAGGRTIWYIVTDSSDRDDAASTVLNAPIVATGDGPFDVVKHVNTADRVLAIDVVKRTVTLLLSHGFAEGRRVVYVSTEASDPMVATIERATYVPSLALAGGEISIIVFANGQGGAANPQRQGLAYAAFDGKLRNDATTGNAAMLDTPRSILSAFPTGATAATYSPLWSVSMAVWSPSAIVSGQNTLQTDQASVYELLKARTLTGPDGKPFGSVGILVNCPVIAYLDAAP